MANSVVHFEVNGEDGPALQKFFGDLFDWEIATDNPMNYGVVSAPSEVRASAAALWVWARSSRPPGSRSTWAWTT